MENTFNHFAQQATLRCAERMTEYAVIAGFTAGFAITLAQLV